MRAMFPWWPKSIQDSAKPVIVGVVSAIAIVALLALAIFHRHPVVRAPQSAARVTHTPHRFHATIIPPRKIASLQTVVVLMPSDFDKEQQMSFGQLMKRWDPFIAEAATRFTVPQTWIRAVMHIESGGRTMLGEHQPITSSAGAMGLMQLLPSTYEDMRRQYRLGPNPYDPRDNILAGAAYLHLLRSKYPYPTMFAAYNDGPGHLDERMIRGGLLPAETIAYVGNITGRLEGTSTGPHSGAAKFTRPNGAPVYIDAGAVVSVRAAFPDEYAPGVLSVITVGRLRQGVRESLASARATIRAHGGGV